MAAISLVTEELEPTLNHSASAEGAIRVARRYQERKLHLTKTVYDFAAKGVSAEFLVDTMLDALKAVLAMTAPPQVRMEASATGDSAKVVGA